MAESQVTPHKPKGPRYANGQKDVHSTGTSVQDGWASELSGRILLANIPLESYLDQLVPCSSLYESANLSIEANAFSAYKPGAGLEVQNTPHACAGLQALVSDFDDGIRLSFWDTHNGEYRFPLSPFASNHAKSSPDISVSFPGVNADEPTSFRSSRWEMISMCIEVKDTEKQDPFPIQKAGKSNMETIIQIARNARTLMLVHGFLYSFVLGIYGDIVRIARFDRTVCVVSRPFNLRQNLHILQRFFWHYTHPIVGSPVVGCDPTIRSLTVPENAWLQRHLSRARVERTDMDVFMTRRVEVYNPDGTMVPYFVYQLIDVNPRLMSRSTMVWRAIKDTYEDDKRARNSVKTCILKESWRQLVRRPEADFYRRMESTISDEEWWGLPKMLGGGDIGQLELQLWETCSSNADELVGERHLRLSVSNGTVPPSSSSNEPDATCSSSSAAPSSDPTMTPPSSESLSPVASQYPYPFSSPLPWPQHQTVTWSISTLFSMYTHRERSHMRFVMENVGRPLTEFRDTRELIISMRDAIRGHQLAWEKAGILHRDISLGNILIADDPTAEGFVGFLHDFDYSSMTEVAPGHPKPASTSTSSKVANPELKERTGTRYFMSCNILLCGHLGVIHRVYHDLESAYWVVLWIVLRHTQHNRGQKVLEQIFEHDDLEAAFNKKAWWLLVQGRFKSDSPLIIENNAPLTELMSKLKALVFNMVQADYQSDHLTHESVLRLFDDALAQPGWPTASDHVKYTLLDPRSKQGDEGGLRMEPEIRRMAVSDSAVLAKRSGTIAELDVPPPILEQGADAEAGHSSQPVREDRPSNRKRRKTESQAAAMGPPPSRSTLLGPSSLERAAVDAPAGVRKKSRHGKRL